MSLDSLTAPPQDAPNADAERVERGAAQSWPERQTKNGGADPSDPARVEPGRGGGHGTTALLSSPAPANLSDPATAEEQPIEVTRDRGDGQWTSATPQAFAVADLSARHRGPEPHSTNASDGSAHISPDTLGSSGAPTPHDPAFEVPKTDLVVPGHGDGHRRSANHSTRAVAEPSEPASRTPVPNQKLRAPRGGLKRAAPQSSDAPATPSDPATVALHPDVPAPDRGDGPSTSDTPSWPAVAQESRPAKVNVETVDAMPGGGDGQSRTDAHSASAVATIVDLWRQRVDLRRAEGRLNLQALATCRRAVGGDKEAAQKAWLAIQRGKEADPNLALVVEPYRNAMSVLDTSAKGLEKQLAKLVRPLPLWTWAKDVRGLGELTIAGLIGEAAGNPGAYRSVSALWKRFGLAVIEGMRQRRVADAQAALIHGYAPQRRAFAYVISTQLMRSQREGDPYRALYDSRKAYELAREIPKAHAHNRALRYMVKALFKDVWAADRRGRSA